MSKKNVFDKAVDVLANTFSVFKGKMSLGSKTYIEDSLEGMKERRGLDEIAKIPRFHEESGGQTRLILPDTQAISMLLHFPKSGKNPHRAIDTLAKTDEAEVVPIKRNQYFYRLHEGGVLLNPAAHRCGGTGVCVPTALHAVHEGGKSFKTVLRDLKRIGLYMADIAFHPTDFTPVAALNQYLEALGYRVRDTEESINELIGDLPGYADPFGFIPDGSVVNVDLGSAKHVFKMHDGWPVEAKRDLGHSIYAAGGEINSLITPNEGIAQKHLFRDAAVFDDWYKENPVFRNEKDAQAGLRYVDTQKFLRDKGLLQ